MLNTPTKKLFRVITALILFIFEANTLKAQTYQTAMGVKFGGYENGPSIKYFAKPDVAYEGIVGFRKNGLVISGLYEINLTAFAINELKFYYGVGGHIGSIGSGEYQKLGGNNELYKTNQLLLGADGVIGLEYVIPKAPVAVSLDINPRFEVAGGPFFDIAPGLGIKYTF